MTHNAAAAKRPRKFLTLALGGAALLASTIPATSFAKETGGIGGGGGGTTTCSPITSLTLKADPKVAETGTASMDIAYGVKPCINGQTVTVDVNVSEYLTGALFVDMPNSPLNGKFTLNGIRVRVTYKVTVTVFDAVTGAVAGVQSGYVAAIPKSV